MKRVIVVFVPLAIVATLAAQPPSSAAGAVTIIVSESAGMRRTEFPVRATVSLAQRALPGTDAAAHARLMQADTEVPAQYTVMASWPDGSAQSLDVDFNASLTPNEKREYRLEYGANVTAAQKPRGLAVTETADAVQIGNIKFNKSGAPLLASANYRGEFIAQGGQGANGFAILDRDGGRHDLTAAADVKVEIVKRGPLVGTVRYTGTLPIDASSRVPFTLTVEMPNSKSWLKTSAEVVDRLGRVQALAFDTPLSLGAFPLLWDLGTPTNSYGVFRNAQDAMRFEQTVEVQVVRDARGGVMAPVVKGPWHVESTAQNELRPYEVSSTSDRAPIASGWGHLQSPTLAVAFGIQGFQRTAGTYLISLNGQGQASFQFTPPKRTSMPSNDADATRRFAIYEHFVTTPVPIGAATSPASMVNAPTVAVQR